MTGADMRGPVWRRWDDPVWDVPVFLMKGTIAQLQEMLSETFGPEYAKDEDLTEAPLARTLFLSHERGKALVFCFRDSFDPNNDHWLSVLAHETLHAAHFVLMNRGVRLTPDSDEAFCYYQAWLFREVLVRLRAWGPAREACTLCGNALAIGYHVPDEMWQKIAMPNVILCLSCFTTRADAKRLPWDRDIVFFPVSLATHESLPAPETAGV